MVPMDDAALARGADEVVRGEVTDVHAGWTADQTQIVTTASVRVKGRAKGTGPDTLTLTSLGGTMGEVTQWVEDQPVFVPGTEAFLFVKHGAKGQSVYGGLQGVVPVDRGRVRGNGKTKGGGASADAYGQYLGVLASGKSASAPSAEPAPRSVAAPTPVITGVSPPSASAGTGTEITITGTGFGSKASRESYADVGFFAGGGYGGILPIWTSGYPYYHVNENEIVSWTDTQIVVTVPDGLTADGFLSSASSGWVWVLTDGNVASENFPFSVTFGYADAKWLTSPVPFPINPDGMTPEMVAAILNASETWNAAVPDASFRFEYTGPTSSRTIGSSMPNLVLMGTPEEFGYSEGTYAYTSVCGGGAYGISNCVLRLNPMYAWTGGTPGSGQVSIEAVALHEFGHWLFLRDLYGQVIGYPRDTGKVMFGYGDARSSLTARISLTPGDLAGIRWIYANGAPHPSPPPVKSTPVPYPGPHTVPSRIEAENFDAGGEGLAYHDTEPANLGGAYRPTQGVDIYLSNGTTFVGGVRSGEWLAYTVNASAPQDVLIRLRLSNPDTALKQIDYYADGGFAGLAEVRGTGAIDSFTTIDSRAVWLPEGATTLVMLLPDRVGLDWLELVPTVPSLPPITKTPTPTPVVPQPYPGVHTVPGTVQAEDFDAGGEGVAYHDAESANLGGAYRPGEGVDLETSGGITDVGWVRTGEWLRYTVNTTSPQNVMLRLRVSNPDAATKEIPILVNEEFLSTVWVPSTGSFGTFATIDAGPFPLPAGETGIRLVFEQVDRVNLDWLEFAPAVVPMPGVSGIPTDTNGDGKYEDVNGNGRKDFNDVVLYFNQMSWITENEPLWALDYNGNGRIDFADVVWLFNHL
jgi:PKD repeat protein